MSALEKGRIALGLLNNVRLKARPQLMQYSDASTGLENEFPQRRVIASNMSRVDSEISIPEIKRSSNYSTALLQ